MNMEIDGPLNFGVVENRETMTRDLNVTFTSEFKQHSPHERALVFSQFVGALRARIASLDEDDLDTGGLMVILQISEQLLPHIERDEIPLNDTIIVELRSGNTLQNAMGTPTLQ